MSEMQARLDLVREPILEPERRIIDPHHHFWRTGRGFPYVLEDLWADTSSGHRIEQTVFIECGAEYLDTGPLAMRPVGETRFVEQLAAASRAEPGKAQVAAIVGHADLSLGAAVEEVLAAQIEAGKGLFRGIRHHATWDASADVPNSRINPPPHLFTSPAFREGFARLAPLGLTFDSWNYHPQIWEVADLARAFPGTTIILNHFGGPIGIGPYADHRDEVFEHWKRSIDALSACPNVYAKLGGLAMPVNGFGWDTRERPATSDEIVAAQRPYYRYAIEKFGPQRCMFESNFPVEKVSVSYAVAWNAFKKIAGEFTEHEKDAMFRGTAARVYRLDPGR
jgi:predicted TIM-barrel fold metal-dependent hydrolase